MARHQQRQRGTRTRGVRRRRGSACGGSRRPCAPLPARQLMGRPVQGVCRLTDGVQLCEGAGGAGGSRRPRRGGAAVPTRVAVAAAARSRWRRATAVCAIVIPHCDSRAARRAPPVLRPRRAECGRGSARKGAGSGVACGAGRSAPRRRRACRDPRRALRAPCPVIDPHCTHRALGRMQTHTRGGAGRHPPPAQRRASTLSPCCGVRGYIFSSAAALSAALAAALCCRSVLRRATISGVFVTAARSRGALSNFSIFRM